MAVGLIREIPKTKSNKGFVVASQEASALSIWTGHLPWIERSFGDLVGH